MDQKEKKVTDDLKIHEEYFVNLTKTLLSAYKDALGPAIAVLREHMKNLKRTDKAIDPDEEFLQDIEQRQSLEYAYISAETKVITIFDAAESVRVQFYQSIDNVSMKDVEPVHELCEDIEKIKSDFESSPRPYLGNDTSTNLEIMISKGSPRKGVSPSSKLALTVDIKSIFTQKLAILSPKKKPYMPLGVSSENSQSDPNHKQEDVHVSKDDKSPTLDKQPSIGKENRDDSIVETHESNSTSDTDKLLEPSNESGNLATEASRSNDENPAK
ncbi:hypothetical protein LXL04_012627 [Taraxacum kok-saghyz]